MASPNLNATEPSSDTPKEPMPERLPERLRQPSWLGQVMSRTLGRWGARLGAAWVVVLVLMAVFGPVIANSHPLLWKHQGQVSSPWAEHLTPVDVTLFVTFFVAVGLWFVVWWGPGLKMLVLAGVVVITGCISFMTVQPPGTVVFQKYREATVAGEVNWAIYAPIAFSPNDRQRDKMAATGVDPRLLEPSREHWMGTTENGADLLSRMIHACRIALAIGLIATGIAVAIGVVVGGLMGYFSGWVDLLGMRLVEIFSAIPVIFLLIAIVAFYGRNLYLMMVIIGLTGWVGYALFVRAEFLKLRSMDYVMAAKAAGLPLWSILFRHMLPNGVTPVLVLASFGIASAILTESTLSFLGLGLVEEPSWGQMLNAARDSGTENWALLVFPGLAIFLTVFAYNLIGESLRDALDPHAKK